MSSGEEKAWNILRSLEPKDVCRNAMVGFNDLSTVYTMRSFGMDLIIDLKKSSIYTDAAAGDLLLKRLGYFSVLSILWYLASAKNIPLSGKLVKPVNLKGGQIFFRGTHVLPLDNIATRFAHDAEGFLQKGTSLGGRKLNHGDASLELYPFPRIPVVVILWLEDEEFPPRADLLFDSSCEVHLALDILWSTAMKSLLIMM